MKRITTVLLILALLMNFLGYTQNTIIPFQKSSIAPIIDGVIAADEWADATEVNIIGKVNLQVSVLVKYDTENLFIAFSNLTDSNNIRRNTEILLHTNPENATWDENAYWFHASYSNCAAIGEYYNWEDCTMNPPDWKANTFPFKNDNDNIEFKISFKKLQITPSANATLRIAFKLSDPLEQHQYWPSGAEISNPSSWGILQF